jgi:hypothetical protein
VLRFDRSARRWWNKPLVREAGVDLPAELVILRALLGPDEEGAWMNSRGRKSGVVALEWGCDGRARTIRRRLPDFVGRALGEIYEESHLVRGCPDLVIWNSQRQNLRLVEVKCPHWDRPSSEQIEFMRVAAQRGVPTDVAEWEFVQQCGDAS